MKRIVLGLLMAAAVGCATTRFHGITSHVAPGTHYKKIIVHSDLADPQTRKTVEDSVVRQFQAIGVSATPSYSIFPAGDNDAWDVKKKAIQSDGFDAGLLVQVTDSNSTTTQVAFTFGQTAQISTAHFKIETELVETNGFAAVWQAETSSREGMDDNGDFSLKTMMDSYASTLVGELQSEGIVSAAMNLESIGR